MMDENILAELDRDKDVVEKGRSAVFRKLAIEYLRRKKEKEISSLYRKAYVHQEESLVAELEGWDREGVWPEE